MLGIGCAGDIFRLAANAHGRAVARLSKQVPETERIPKRVLETSDLEASTDMTPKLTP